MLERFTSLQGNGDLKLRKVMTNQESLFKKQKKLFQCLVICEVSWAGNF